MTEWNPLQNVRYFVADFAIQGEIDMEETKNLCIYTNKDDTQAHFKNQEHIIPACIGGMKKLPKGYVSDEVNTLFSGLELKLARNSPITLVRMFVGPGKRGSHNPKRRGGASKIVSVMQSDETGEYSLGYMRVGAPITIDQIHMVYLEGGKRQTSFRFDTETVDEDHFQERVAEWIHELAEFDGQATMLQEEGMPENEIILGKESGRWYLAVPTGGGEETLKANLIKELRLLGAAYEQELLNQSGACLQDKRPTGIEGFGTAHRAENHVTSDIRQEIDLYAYYRVVAKIAFNCLAEVRGREYVMQQKFDPIRETILTGEEIDKIVLMPGREKTNADVLEKLENAKGFGVWRHMICITQIPNGLVAEVMLYGGANPMVVVLSEEDCRDFGEMDGYVCDWENRREMRFLDYLGEITREDSEPYKWDEEEE